MKSFLQLFLFAILIIIFYFFYKSYFVEHKNIERSIVEKPLENPLTDQGQIIEQKENADNTKNLITNLTYKVDLVNAGKYEIKSGSSEVIYEDGFEIVLMKSVSAVLLIIKTIKFS